MLARKSKKKNLQESEVIVKLHINRDDDSAYTQVQEYLADRDVPSDEETFSAEDIARYTAHGGDAEGMVPFTQLEAYFDSPTAASKFTQWVTANVPGVTLRESSL